MMSKKEKIFTLVTNSISFLLFLVILVPFGAGSVSNFEVIFKFVIAPILMCVIFALNSYVKYVVGSNAYKYTSFSAYAGIFLYFVGLFGYTVLVMLKSGAGSVYEISQWIILLLIFVLAACVFAVLGIFVNRFVIFISTKENVFLDLGLFVVLVALTAVLKSVVAKHVGLAVLSADALKFIVVPAMFGLAIVLFLVFVMLNYLNYNERFVYASRKELIEKWNEGREAVYKQAELDILYNLYDFSKSELGIEEIVVFDEEETPVEEVVEEAGPVEEVVEEAAPVEEVVEEVIEEADPEVEKVEEVEEVQEEIDPKLLEEVDSKISELLKLKEELTAEEVEEVQEEIKTSLPEKEFKPSFADMVRYAKNLKGVTFQGNEQGTNYKFLVDKKVFLILNDTPRDYRLTFLMDLPQASEYAQILAFSKAKSPKGIYSFKLVSKGEFDEETIKGIIKGSYEMVEIIKQRAIAEKEAEKARKAEERLQAKLAEMTEEQRVKYLARLEKKRMLEAMTPEEREQYELDQERAKEEAKEAKIAEQKAKEEAKLAEQKAREEAKAAAEEEKARLAAEKEAEKARIAAEKEEERARIAAEKEEEKARLAAEKEEERARIAAEKEEEKARLAAEKQKAKEKEAAEKAKEKEKARLAAEKQKAKEKEAAQKAKEKEKARLAAEKQKAKEKEAAQKAKEEQAA